MDRDRFYREVTDFLTGPGRAGAGADSGGERPSIAPDSNLFDLGLVNSFSIIRMIVFIEELTGVQIDLADHEVESFYTLEGLYQLATEVSA